MQESIQEIFQDTIFQNIKSLKKEDSREHVREQWKWTQKTVIRKSNSTKPCSIVLFMNSVTVSSTQK